MQFVESSLMVNGQHGSAIRLIGFGLVVMINVSCVVLLRPQGEWSEPVDLKLTKKSLDGLTIKVDCLDVVASDDDASPGGIDAPEATTENNHKMCGMIRKNLEVLGASVIKPLDDAEQAPTGPLAAKPQDPDLTVMWVGKPSSVDYCWAAIWVFIYPSLSIVPCIVDTTVHAELRILDRRGVLKDRKEMSLVSHRIHGIWALPYLIKDIGPDESRRTRQKRLRSRMSQYIQNTVVSYARRPNQEGAH